MMTRVGFVPLVVVLTWVLLAACSPASSPTPILSSSGAQVEHPALPRNVDGYVDLAPVQLFRMLEQKDFVFVNVHIPYEGELPQTDLFIPFDEIKQFMDKLPDKDASIVLYCRSGRMSTEAAKTLVTLGYTHVHELDGGFNAWQASGYKLLRTP